MSIHILEEDPLDHVRWGGLPSLHPWQGRVCWYHRKNDAVKFLDLESTLDDEISPCVRVYELEDVRKRLDETIDVLINCIDQLACHALMGVMQLVSLKFSADWFVPFQMVILSYGKSFSRSFEARVSDIYWTMPFSLELLQCVLEKPSMQYRSPIDLKSNHRSISHSAGISHTNIHLGVTFALPEHLSAKVVWRKDIGKTSVVPARKTNLLLQWTANQKVCLVSMERRGRRLTS